MTTAILTRIPPARRLVLEAALEAEGRAAERYNGGDFVGSVPHFLEARRLGLDRAMICIGLGTAYMRMGKRREAILEYRQALRKGATQPGVLNNLIFLLDHEPGTTLEQALAMRKEWYRVFGAPLRSTWRPHANDPDPERPLRVGYVSGDFRRHSAAQAFGPVVLRPNPGVRSVCYFTHDDEDEITQTFEEETEFHRVADLSEEALAARIRADRIDVLVDCAAFSGNGRLLTFCRRPAPVQFTGWGYATGTGMPPEVFDGFFADAVSVPPALAARGYTEPIRYLPSIIPFTPMPYSDPVGPLPCLAAGVFTFGSLNRWMKMSPAVVETWAEILAQTPASRLLLKEAAYDRPEVRAEVLAVMARHGVAAERILFRGWSDHRTHLQTYHEVDLALDPFPHGGGVTALEGLWHGVPPVSLLGERVPERLSASLCAALNLKAFIVETRADYVETAVLLATRFRAQLTEIRQTLQFRIAESPLVQGYAAAVETHYREAWRRWCQRRTA